MDDNAQDWDPAVQHKHGSLDQEDEGREDRDYDVELNQAAQCQHFQLCRRCVL